MIEIPTSVGELFDKITILEIKEEQAQILEFSDKLVNIRNELKLLREKSNQFDVPKDIIEQLKISNKKIWDVEESLRALESASDFGDSFIENARQVYFNNDTRSQIKRKINEITSSYIVEEKIYKATYR
jgi:hypothetical protein